MPAQPRDLLKPRAQRLMEVAMAAQQQAGLADGQYVTFGCKLGPGTTNTSLFISDGEYFLGQSLIEFPPLAAAGVTMASLGIVTVAAGTSCLVLIEADGTQPTPVLTATQGVVVTSGTPVMPTPNPARIVLGYLSLGPTVFTIGTTPLTSGGYSLAPTGLINTAITQSYDGGNVNPAGTQGPTGSSGGF